MAKTTRKQLAEMLGISEGTVRKYEREFARWLVTPPGIKGKPKAKVYEEEDVRTLFVIHKMREANVSYQDMKAGELEEALASGAYEVELQEAPKPSTEREEPQSSALVPVEKYALVVGELQATEREIERVLEEKKEERERLEAELKEERERVIEAEKTAAAAQATSEERDRLLERLERMEGKLDAVQEELQSERGKTWWDKVRGK